MIKIFLLITFCFLIDKFDSIYRLTPKQTTITGQQQSPGSSWVKHHWKTSNILTYSASSLTVHQWDDTRQQIHWQLRPNRKKQVWTCKKLTIIKCRYLIHIVYTKRTFHTCPTWLENVNNRAGYPLTSSRTLCRLNKSVKYLKDRSCAHQRVYKTCTTFRLIQET